MGAGEAGGWLRVRLRVGLRVGVLQVVARRRGQAVQFPLDECQAFQVSRAAAPAAGIILHR